MIESLTVCDLALIAKAELTFGGALTVLTGETGAGKTMLVEALNLALGERADAGLVRDGCDSATVRLTWRRRDGSCTVLERIVSRDGRHRCLVDGKQVTASALGERTEGLVDLHGQHEHQRLLHARWHSDYLDRFAGEAALDPRHQYAAALGVARRAHLTLTDLEAAEADRERLTERLRYEIAEIEDVAPTTGEMEDLEARLPVLRHAEQLAEAVGSAYALLQSADDPHDTGAVGAAGGRAALDGLRAAAAALEPATAHDPALAALAARGQGLLVELEDVAHCLLAYLDGIDRDPDAYARAEERAARLARLSELYGGSIPAVLDHLERCRDTLDALTGGEERRVAVQEEMAEAMDRMVRASDELSAVREQAAPRFAAAVQEAARHLAMPHARFVVDLERLQRPADGSELARCATDGLDRVEFLFSANEGESVRSLGRVASGGELSRLMLATKTVMGAADCVEALVFDEIDAGIGGQAAVSVAEALRDLARDHQVLVITHLAQIAAAADAHLVVEKAVRGGRTVTETRVVLGDARSVELARMLSGDADSEASLVHAREMLTRQGGP